MKKFKIITISAFSLILSACGGKSVDIVIPDNNCPSDKALVEKALGGDEEAGLKIAQMYYNGDGVVQDYTEAIKWYRYWAERGNPYAQYYMGICHDEGRGLEASLTKAMDFYKQSFLEFKSRAEKGDKDAMLYLGKLYSLGKYVTKDKVAAVKWYREAAEQGDARAQYTMGVCYDEGFGVARSNEEAVKWYRQAAEQGNAEAQCALGACFEEGRGVEKSATEAVKWYRLSAEQGNADAQCNLGYCFDEGIGVEQSAGEAVNWYRLSAEQGNATAQNNLG